MQLNSALAHQIIDKAHAILKRDIMLADLSGQLLATSNGYHREFVPEALAVAQTGHSTSGHFCRPRHQMVAVRLRRRHRGRVWHSRSTPPRSLRRLSPCIQGLAEVIVYQHFLLDKNPKRRTRPRRFPEAHA